MTASSDTSSPLSPSSNPLVTQIIYTELQPANLGSSLPTSTVSVPPSSIPILLKSTPTSIQAFPFFLGELQSSINTFLTQRMVQETNSNSNSTFTSTTKMKKEAFLKGTESKKSKTEAWVDEDQDDENNDDEDDEDDEVEQEEESVK